MLNFILRVLKSQPRLSKLDMRLATKLTNHVDVQNGMQDVASDYITNPEDYYYIVIPVQRKQQK